MYGDHQPAIEAEFIEMVTSEIGLDGQVTSESYYNRYVTNFFLWGNYDINESYIDRISANYLSVMLLDVAGLPKTKYHMYLSELYQQYPVITSQVIIDSNGSYYDAISEIGLEAIEQYKRIIYNHTLDEDGQVSNFYLLNKAE